MTTNELRINNLVLYNQQIIVVKNIAEKSINLEFEPKTFKVLNWIPVSELDPLPISNNLLYKLGYRHQGISFLYETEIGRIFIKRKVNNFYLSINNIYGVEILVASVHQLQNIMQSTFNIILKHRLFL